MKFGMLDKLIGVTTTCKAKINNPKTKASWEGTLKFKWDDVTLQQMLDGPATDSRKIAYATTARKDLGTLRGKKTITIQVSPPGTRASVTPREITRDDLEKYLATLSDVDALAAVKASRSNK